MGTVMTGILTDTTLRSSKAVQAAMMQEAEIAGPWFNAPEA